MSRQWQNAKYRDFKDEQHTYKDQEVYRACSLQRPQTWRSLSRVQNHVAADLRKDLRQSSWER